MQSPSHWHSSSLRGDHLRHKVPMCLAQSQGTLVIMVHWPSGPAQPVPLEGPPAQHSSHSSMRVCRWLHVAGSSTPGSSASSGWASTCLHPPPCSATVLHFCWVLHCGTPPAWAAPGTPQSQPWHSAPFKHFPRDQDTVRQFTWLSLSDMVTPGAATASWAVMSSATVLSPTSKPSGIQQTTFHCPQRHYWIAPWSARMVPAASPCLGTLVAAVEPSPTATPAHSLLPAELLTPD